ncbi:MAG: periplasmic heavy metal sensor [Chitinispirillaceae bacterium]|nr:periplasmic heavy metal sensor [Chitinispirillaceae bacterium]
MKVTTLMRGLITGVLVLSPLAVSAQPDQGKMKKHQEKMAVELKLSDDQKAKLKELRTTHHESMKPFYTKMKGVRDKIKTELLKPQPSKQRLDAFAAELGSLHKQMAIKRNEHLLQVKAVLNEEQFKELVNRDWKQRAGIKGKRPYRGDRRGMRGPGPGPDDGPEE